MENRAKTAVLLGASGLVGSCLLDDLLNSDTYKEVVVFVRKDLDIRHDKLKVHVIDFDKPASYESLVVGDDLYCCLGTTIKKSGSEDAFRKIDYNYPISFAQIAKNNGIKQYLIVSSIGANASSSIFYLKTKGECEEALRKIGFVSLSIFRPSSLAGNRKEYRLNEKIMLPILKVLSFLLVGKLRKYRAIKATTVAKSMLKIATKEVPGVSIYESNDIASV